MLFADLERALAAPPAPGTFDDADVERLPEPVARYLRASISPGTPRFRATRLEMRGRIKVGRWMPFTATEILDPLRGFVWSARVAGRLLTGADHYLDGEGAMEFRLLGLVPVARAGGADLSRSAAARAGGESLWLPTALLAAGDAVDWSAPDESLVVARFTIDGTPVVIRNEIDRDGRMRAESFERWGDPDRSGRYGWHRFGGEVTAHRSFGGLTVPSAGRFGWHHGTDRWSEGEFFRYEITRLDPVAA